MHIGSATFRWFAMLRGQKGNNFESDAEIRHRILKVLNDSSEWLTMQQLIERLELPAEQTTCRISLALGELMATGAVRQIPTECTTHFLYTSNYGA